MPDLFYQNNIKGWAPGLCGGRPDITTTMCDAFLNKMYRTNADFVFTVTRDFVHQCQTPVLILPDDVPAHPYAVALESAHLAPNAQVSIYPWKANPEQIQLALRHVRAFLKANQPASAAGRRSNRRPPPRNSLPFPWSPGLSRDLHGHARNAIWLWSVYLTGASALFCRFGGGSDANNVEGSGGHLGRPGGGRVKSGNGDVPLCGGLQVL